MLSNKININTLSITELEKYNLKIITMTIGCCTKNIFNLYNISNNIDLHSDQILSVKFKDNSGRIIMRNALPRIKYIKKMF